MCVSPLLIKNSHFGHNKSKLYKHDSFLHDTTSQYIYVPCGYCKECIAVKQMYLVQRVQMEALNSFMFFSTLTYNNEHLPKLLTSTGYEIPFADYRHLRLMMCRLRENDAFKRPFRFLACSERGKEKSRPHFHILWFFKKYDNEVYADGLSLQKKYYDIIRSYWSVNVGSKRKPIYEPLFTFKQKFYRGKLYTNYDTHFVIPSLTSEGISSVAFYVCKYLLKPSNKERRLQQAFKLNLESDEYDSSWNLVKSRSFRSSCFGYGFDDASVVKYLRDCVNRSDRSLGYPCYFNPDTGASFPLAPYYKNDSRIFTYKDMLDFKMDTPLIYEPELSVQDYQQSVHKFLDIQNHVDSKDLSLDFNFLFDED